MNIVDKLKNGREINRKPSKIVSFVSGKIEDIR